MAKKNNNLFLFPLAVSVLFILMGGAMVVKGLVAYGVNSRTLKMSGLGGHLFIGVIFLIVTYYSLSPFSRIRNINFNFFKRKRKRNR